MGIFPWYLAATNLSWSENFGGDSKRQWLRIRLG